jgi:hypothetical protein
MFMRVKEDFDRLRKRAFFLFVTTGAGWVTAFLLLYYPILLMKVVDNSRIYTPLSHYVYPNRFGITDS